MMILYAKVKTTMTISPIVYWKKVFAENEAFGKECQHHPHETNLTVMQNESNKGFGRLTGGDTAL
jgi:hypothetical protein